MIQCSFAEMLFESAIIFEYLLSCNVKMYSLGSKFLVKFALKKKKSSVTVDGLLAHVGFAALKAGPAVLLTVISAA